jgi:hypothetical protein
MARVHLHPARYLDIRAIDGQHLGRRRLYTITLAGKHDKPESKLSALRACLLATKSVLPPQVTGAVLVGTSHYGVEPAL